MIRIEPHPWERVMACKRQHGTDHTHAEMTAGLRREFLRREHTYTEELGLLEEHLEQRQRGPDRPS